MSAIAITVIYSCISTNRSSVYRKSHRQLIGRFICRLSTEQSLENRSRTSSAIVSKTPKVWRWVSKYRCPVELFECTKFDRIQCSTVQCPKCIQNQIVHHVRPHKGHNPEPLSRQTKTFKDRPQILPEDDMQFQLVGSLDLETLSKNFEIYLTVGSDWRFSNCGLELETLSNWKIVIGDPNWRPSNWRVRGRCVIHRWLRQVKRCQVCNTVTGTQRLDILAGCTHWVYPARSSRKRSSDSDSWIQTVRSSDLDEHPKRTVWDCRMENSLSLAEASEKK